jgi:hypothetical protein
MDVNVWSNGTGVECVRSPQSLCQIVRGFLALSWLAPLAD